MKEVWYSVNDDDGQYSIETSYNINDSFSLECIAKLCAENYHSEHDGWEAAWPLDITLYESEDGPAIATFEVNREAEPVFYARRKIK